jgi:hypothetical protein
MSAIPYKTTVSVVATSIDLTVLATVKAELVLTTVDAARDALLAAFITQASNVCANYCNRMFAEETLVDHFRLSCYADCLVLSRMPVTSITTVVENGVTLTADDYEFDVATGFLWRLDGEDNRSCWSSSKIVVTYVAGYELLATLPYDIERACITLVKQSYFAKTRDPMVKAVDLPGLERTEYWVGSVPGDSSTLPDEVQALLNPYRIIAV